MRAGNEQIVGAIHKAKVIRWALPKLTPFPLIIPITIPVPSFLSFSCVANYLNTISSQKAAMLYDIHCSHHHCNYCYCGCGNEV